MDNIDIGHGLSLPFIEQFLYKFYTNWKILFSSFQVTNGKLKIRKQKSSPLTKNFQNHFLMRNDKWKPFRIEHIHLSYSITVFLLLFFFCVWQSCNRSLCSSTWKEYFILLMILSDKMYYYYVSTFHINAKYLSASCIVCCLNDIFFSHQIQLIIHFNHFHFNPKIFSMSYFKPISFSGNKNYSFVLFKCVVIAFFIKNLCKFFIAFNIFFMKNWCFCNMMIFKN